MAIPAIPPRALARTQTTPIAVPRSRRAHVIRGLTSLPAGKMTPLFVIPLLREDDLRCSVRFSFEMMETVEILMNAVNVNVKAYLVPTLAFDRFSGMDELNRAYAGVPNQEGGAVTPFIELKAGEALGVNKIHEYMGKHVKPGVMYNTAYVEAYNEIWNFRAKNRSEDITPRGRLAVDLAPAFWQHEQFAAIVPTFDQAIIDGEVPLNVINGQLTVKSPPGVPLKLTNMNGSWNGDVRARATADLFANAAVEAGGNGMRLSDAIVTLFAELEENGITVSLSNIELAKKTQAFARLRMQFSGFDEDYIIDMLMNGLTIPEMAYKQPILLAERSTVFGMSKRYASDADNLTESVVNGMTQIEMNLRCPRVPMGGVVMIVAEVTPEQLFERQRDPYLHAANAGVLPEYLRDTLDPEKVQVVQNAEIDTSHTVPAGTFGYAPLHWNWNHYTPGIGGKYFRATPTAEFDEIRQRIWAVETPDPILSEDFYLCTKMNMKPFVVTNQDPFEVVSRGEAAITGNTVFGHPLIEATGEYDAVMEQAPTDRIDLPVATTEGRNNMDAPSLAPAAE